MQQQSRISNAPSAPRIAGRHLFDLVSTIWSFGDLVSGATRQLSAAIDERSVCAQHRFGRTQAICCRSRPTIDHHGIPGNRNGGLGVSVTDTERLPDRLSVPGGNERDRRTAVAETHYLSAGFGGT